MTQPTAITVSEEPKESKQIKAISDYLYRPNVIQKFSEMLGEKSARRFVASVLTAVMADPKLQICSGESVYLAAVRSATLGMSVDPAYGQAYLVAYGNVCTFLPGYKGFVDKAADNGIGCHVDEIYDNEEVRVDRFTGDVKIEGENGFWRKPSSNAETDSNGHKIAGYIATFWETSKPQTGLRKSLYMTIGQIEEYAEVNAPAYHNQQAPWNKNKLSRKEMFKKTVLKLLLRKYAPLNPVVSRLLIAFNDDQHEQVNAAFDGIDIKGIEEPAEKRPAAVILGELGFDNPDPVDEKTWSRWQDLLKEADALKIQHGAPDRTAIAKVELIEAGKELRRQIEDVKAQSASESESQ